MTRLRSRMTNIAHDEWLATHERVYRRLTDRGKILVETLDERLDIGWSAADADRYWDHRRANIIHVALVERAAYKKGRRAFANELHELMEKGG